MMSEKAIGCLHALPTAEKTVSLVQADINEEGKLKSGTEVGSSEVEYVESENLNDVEDVDTSLKTLIAGLDSKDWVLVCETLNDVRRLCIFHKEAMLEMLETIISLVVKSLKNPRSAVCKTAIMTAADIFKAYGERIVDTMDPMLLQLLLKSSQDKRFVCEAAERSLTAMTTWVSPALLLPKLQPYLKNRNPRIRAKASMCFSRSVPNLGADGIQEYGLEKLIQIAASQLSDQLPESREAARALIVELQTVHDKKSTVATGENPEETTTTASSWEQFCQSKLSPLSAQAVLRVTNAAPRGDDGLLLGS